MALLSDDEISARLAAMPGWEHAGGTIRKEYITGDFRRAVAFVVRIAFEAEAANHHPDLDVRYNRVTVALSTHSEGGVTDKDVELASALEGLTG